MMDMTLPRLVDHHRAASPKGQSGHLAKKLHMPMPPEISDAESVSMDRTGNCGNCTRLSKGFPHP